jgi:hypothetical protein
MKPLYLLDKKAKLLIIAFALVHAQAGAQISQTASVAQPYFPVTDSAPAVVNGLQAGYTITGESEKEVGKKGNFSRYKLKFYITNTTNQPVILSSAQNPNQAGPPLVRFTCLNATGARFTSKECTLAASPQNTETWEDGRDAHGNAIRIRRVVNHGFGIRPGETISTTNNIIMIVPLDQRPEINAVFSPGLTGFVAAAPGPVPPAPQSGSSVVRLRNTSSGAYLNAQNGQVGCNSPDRNVWGSEWELLPVPGTKYFLIRNKVQQKFLSAENNGLLADNSQSQAALWSVEQSLNTPGFRISNVQNNTILVAQNGIMLLTSNAPQDNSGFWLVEHY